MIPLTPSLKVVVVVVDFFFSRGFFASTYRLHGCLFFILKVLFGKVWCKSVATKWLTHFVLLYEPLNQALY